jgi:hypothetical protein
MDLGMSLPGHLGAAALLTVNVGRRARLRDGFGFGPVL